MSRTERPSISDGERAKHTTLTGRPSWMKSARERMDIVNAYAELGSYRAVAGLWDRGRKPAVLRGAVLESISVRAVRGRPAAGDDAPLAGRVLRGAGRGAGGGADRPDELLERWDGRERGGAASRVRAVRSPVRV